VAGSPCHWDTVCPLQLLLTPPEEVADTGPTLRCWLGRVQWIRKIRGSAPFDACGSARFCPWGVGHVGLRVSGQDGHIILPIVLAEI
jgi:hypothetical protein